MNVFGLVDEIRKAAQASFFPTSERQEYLQKLSVILDYRTGYPPMRNGKRTIGRQVARKALRELKESRGVTQQAGGVR